VRRTRCAAAVPARTRRGSLRIDQRSYLIRREPGRSFDFVGIGRTEKRSILTTFEIPIWIYPCDALLRTANDTRFMFLFNGIRVVMTIGLVLVGIRLFALGGAIIGAVASETITRVVFTNRERWCGIPKLR
jgi:hypothetical protein